MINLPVIWNHSGTDVSLATGLSFEHLGHAQPSLGAVGKVLDSWVSEDGAGRAIIEVVGRALNALLGTSALPAVSLTHGDQTPIELSIVARPARPGSVIEKVLKTPYAVSEYKRNAGVLSKVTMEVDQASAPQPTPLEQAIDAIPDSEQQKLVTGRMADMARHALDAGKRAKELQSELDSYRKMDEASMAATKEAIAMWVDSLGPDVSCRWNVANLSEANSPNLPMMALRNVVMASHERITQLTTGAPMAKRKAEPVEAPVQRARTSEAAPAPSGPPDDLRAALAATFEGYTL